MQLIGITGYIGSGKTTIGNILQSMGYVVYDMDKWCRKMYFDTMFLKIIKHHFPFCFQNNVFNKKILRQYVFKNKEELKKLESLTHPYLIKKLKKQIYQNRFKNSLFFVETALLYQMKLDKYCTFIIQTTAPVDVMEKRVMKRDNIQKQDYLNILDKQSSFKKFDKKADFIIDTYKTLGIIKTELINILQRIEVC